MISVILYTGCGFQPVALPEGMPLTSSDIITGLNEHLLRVLSELRAKERVVAESQVALERVQRKLAVIIHQQVRRGFQISWNRTEQNCMLKHLCYLLGLGLG